MKDKLLIVCGPSGVGKGSLMRAVYKAYPGVFGLSVSHTTRLPRHGEESGIHYHFIEDGHFQELVGKEGFFLEHAKVHGHYYGTSLLGVQDVIEKGQICVLEVDVQGARKVIQKLDPPPRVLYIAPPSVEVLMARLLGRGTETSEAIGRRVKNARQEMDWCENSGHCTAKVVNEHLPKAVEEVCSLLEAWFPSIHH